MTPLTGRLTTALLALMGHATLYSVADARDLGLDRWVDGELLPYVREQVVGHPRFRGETLMFVVLDDSAPAPVSTALELSLRDRLLDAALQSTGVRVGWRQGNVGPPAAVDCSRDEVHYYVGLELSRRIDGRYELDVRALDLEDRSWVGGFGKTWRGDLNRMQLRAMRETRVDASFLGARDAPFAAAQTDLLAQHLAHELSCGLMRQTNGDYVVPAVPGDGGTRLDATVELASRNIAASAAIQVTRNEERATAELAGSAHRIDGDLHQYWLSITPNGRNAALTTLSASAYVLLPANEMPGRASYARNPPGSLPPVRPQATLSLPDSDTGALIGPLRVVDPAGASECGSREGLLRTSDRWPQSLDCSLLETSALADAVVFFLEHQPQLGLVRLGGRECRTRTTAKVARRGESFRFPIAWFRSASGRTRNAAAWQVSPRLDTYYAIAVADTRSARRLANHIDRLPVRCGNASRPGLVNDELDAWLAELARLAARSGGDFGWRALELQDVS